MRRSKEIGDWGGRGNRELLVRYGSKNQAMVVSRKTLMKSFLELGDGRVAREW